MKLLTLNFLTCAIKTCKTSPSSFPLHPQDSELEIVEADINVLFLRNMLPRLMWNELRLIVNELGLPSLPETAPDASSLLETKLQVPEGDTTGLNIEKIEVPSQVAKDLHRVLLETCIREGKLVCGNCGHEYKVMEGVANFLLPGHLV
ncbi:Trm112p-domain-containing protein [Lindgomyces ingoldianus]|uniref:Trm112p-domain-containing protein n=1 Tax=Lindgomyces ingoldianus TaxID=673940 RepID=A0ACB6R5Q9_9PLEO|nr:Trm112p-domain-containing protein [Lindgomyces ingoldianus]KAF2474511.1 Trm112p-domain-containing protein [Lindgomyces ingoldianus]